MSHLSMDLRVVLCSSSSVFLPDVQFQTAWCQNSVNSQLGGDQRILGEFTLAGFTLFDGIYSFGIELNNVSAEL